jgi:hypothetical protein
MLAVVGGIGIGGVLVVVLIVLTIIFLREAYLNEGHPPDQRMDGKERGAGLCA